MDSQFPGSGNLRNKLGEKEVLGVYKGFDIPWGAMPCLFRA